MRLRLCHGAVIRLAVQMAQEKKSRIRKTQRRDAGHSQTCPESRSGGAALLSWYDRHRRILPWRAQPGERADSYRVWLSEIMLQQTTVKAVAPYFLRFVTRWPTVGALAAAPLDEVLRLWAGLGYYARARNLHACAKAVVERHRGEFPSEEPELVALPGIGPYSAAAIAAIAFGARTAAIDANGERVLARLFAIEAELPAAKPRIRSLAEGLLPPTRAGDFAQALMDLGASICTPKNPSCALCPWMRDCLARRRGDRSHARRQCNSLAQTPATRTARRHGRSADDQMDAELRRAHGLGCFATAARCEAAVAPLTGSRRARVHAFSAAAHGLRGCR